MCWVRWVVAGFIASFVRVLQQVHIMLLCILTQKGAPVIYVLIVRIQPNNPFVRMSSNKINDDDEFERHTTIYRVIYEMDVIVWS